MTFSNLNRLKVLFVREQENEAAWDRSKSIGMTFINTLVCEEDAQFELYGHHKIWWECEGIWSTYYYTKSLVEKAVKNYIKQCKQDDFNDETIHFIWTGFEANNHCFGRPGYRIEIIHIFYNVMIKHGLHKPFMITFLWRMRGGCMAKEDCEAEFKGQDNTRTSLLYKNVHSVRQSSTRTSIGDNLENFIEKIKTNSYSFENAGLESNESYRCFHHAMLTPQEEREIKIPENEFLMTFNCENPDVPAFEIEKSDSNHKYVGSYCVRSTYII